MIEVEISAKVFGGLMVRIETDRNEISDAAFASTGNSLPRVMFDRLVNSAEDMAALNEEIWNAVGTGEL